MEDGHLYKPELRMELDYLRIIRNKKGYYGGTQLWLEELSLKHSAEYSRYGCGYIAALDVYLYLCGKRELDFGEYKQILTAEMKNIHISRYFVTGVHPFISRGSFNDFFRRKFTGKLSKYRGSWQCFRKNTGEKIERMLKQGIPVIFSYYSFAKRPLKLYHSLSGSSCTEVNSHYMVITGCIGSADKKRYVISSWGRKYYINASDFLSRANIFTNIFYIRQG